MLPLLPPGSKESRAVQREVDRLQARINPKPATDWRKKLGPFGVGVAALLKYKTVLLVLLTKGKFIFSLLLFFGAYWAMFGWWFGLGLTGSVLLHEMGHYVFARRAGYSAELPMFIPGFAAYVRWNGAGADPTVRATIALAGPLFGLFSGLIAYGIFVSTHMPVWLAIAHFAGWINLLNLIPVFIFDGASALSGIDKQGRIAILAVSLVMFFVLHEWLFLFVAIATGFRMYQRDTPPAAPQRLALYFVGLILGNGFVSWFSLNQARILFPPN